MGLTTSSGLTSVPTTSQQGQISTGVQPYVSDLLSNTQALADAGMPAYTGQLTAGPSGLQQQSWQGLSSLTLPSDLTQAGANLQNISNQAQNLNYTPTTFTDTYTAPAAYQGINATNQYVAPTAYTPTTVTNTYNPAGQNYKPTDVTTGTFDQAAAQQYMNPYIQQALNPQLAALQRQAQINQQGDLAKLTQAGAYGGSRQSILEGQNQYNLLAQQANLIGQGYNQAYTQAGQQFTADQARNLQAQQANVQQAQYSAQLGMTDAQLQAQYGMTAAQANQAANQFAAQQAQTSAQNAAQYGTAAQAANIQQGQFGAQQAQTTAQQQAQALQAQQAATQAANQFGATYGLQGLQAATTAQQAAANAGAQQAQYGLANLQALNTAGTQQQALNQAALTAQYNQYLNQLQYPQTMATLQANVLKSLPTSAVTTVNTYGAAPSTLQSVVGTAGGVGSLVKNLQGAGLSTDGINTFLKSIGAGSSSSGSGTIVPIDTSTGINVNGKVVSFGDPVTGTGPNGKAGTGQVLGQDGNVYNDPSYEAALKGMQSQVPSGVTINTDPSSQDYGLGSDGIDYTYLVEGP